MIFSGLQFLAREILSRAEEELYDEDKIHHEMTEAYAALEAGSLSEEEFERREAQLMERIETVAARREAAEGGGGEADGDEADGDEADGDEADGDEADGDEADGDDDDDDDDDDDEDGESGNEVHYGVFDDGDDESGDDTSGRGP